MSEILAFLVETAEIIAVTFAVILLFVLAFHLLITVAALVDYYQRHDLSKSYVAGAAAGFGGYAVRNRLGPIEVATLLVAGLVAIVGLGVTEFVEDVVGSTSVSSGNPPPVLAPLKKSELEMPTEPPRRLLRDAAPWPPFTGVRVELGGG